MKQQLRDCQADVSHKLTEIVSLRASLRENTAKMEMLEKQNKDHADKLHFRTIEFEVSLLTTQWQLIAQWPSSKECGNAKCPHSSYKLKELRKDLCVYSLHSTVSFGLFPLSVFLQTFIIPCLIREFISYVISVKMFSLIHV